MTASAAYAGPKHEQPGFDITPKLCESALRGLPLFSRVPVKSDVFGPYSDIDDLRRQARNYAQREYAWHPKTDTDTVYRQDGHYPLAGRKAYHCDGFSMRRL